MFSLTILKAMMKTFKYMSRQQINLIKILPFIVILTIGIYLRYDGIKEQGINRGDSKKYLKEAVLWAQDEDPDFMGGRFYRPVVYYLQGNAVRMFGNNDYSIKILNASLDAINIILIFIIAVLYSRSYLISTAAALFYSFNPKVVYLARIEMVHVESTFFVLLAILSVLLYRRYQKKMFARYFLAYITGLMMGFAINTHAELIFLVPILFWLIIREMDYSDVVKGKQWSLLLSPGLFLVAHLAPYLVGIFYFGFDTVFEVVRNEFTFHTSDVVQQQWQVRDFKLFLPFKIIFFTLYYFFRNTFFIFAGLFFFGLIQSISRLVKKKIKLVDISFYLFILIYISAYTIIFDTFNSAYCRILLPLIPLLLIVSFSSLHELIALLPTTYKKTIFSIIVISLFTVSIKLLPGTFSFQSPYKYLYEQIGDKVDSENKLLIGPLISYYRDQGFRNEFYFKENAEYLGLLPAIDTINSETLKNELIRYNVKFVFLSREIDTRNVDQNYPLNSESMREWVSGYDPYSLKNELQTLINYIELCNGRLISKSNHGYLFELFSESEGTDYDYIVSEYESSEKSFREKDSFLVTKLKGIMKDY